MKAILVIKSELYENDIIKHVLNTACLVLIVFDINAALKVKAEMAVDLCVVDMVGSATDIYTQIAQIEYIQRALGNTTIFVVAESRKNEIRKHFCQFTDNFMFYPCTNLSIEERIINQFEITHHIGTRKEAFQMSYGGYLLSRDDYLLKRTDKFVQLTKLEFSIVSLLLQNKGRIVTRDIILRKVWDDDERYVENNTLTVCISRLRKKLLYSDLGEPIETISGIGYRWRTENNFCK